MRYAYEAPDGGIHWREQPLSAGPPPAEIEVAGQVARRCYRAEQVGGQAPKGWPLTCVASGVHPSQAQELRDELARKGVPTEVTRNGDPVYLDAAHRRRALKARGLSDRSAYY